MRCIDASTSTTWGVSMEAQSHVCLRAVCVHAPYVEPAAPRDSGRVVPSRRHRHDQRPTERGHQVSGHVRLFSADLHHRCVGLQTSSQKVSPRRFCSRAHVLCACVLRMGVVQLCSPSRSRRKRRRRKGNRMSSWSNEQHQLFGHMGTPTCASEIGKECCRAETRDHTSKDAGSLAHTRLSP
jgi:hypothetical protein